MTTIPQRELRNSVSEILRRAESGERFTVTVNGRAVAELAPLERSPAAPERLAAILAGTAVDPRWPAELAQQREEERTITRSPAG